MSKRESAQPMNDDYSIFLMDLQELGYIPEGVLNWIALMGWSYDDHTELFTLDNLVEKFSLEKLNPSPAAINFSKLDHFNGLHIRNLAVDDLARRLKPFFEEAGYQVDNQKLLKVAALVQPRIVTLDDALDMAGFFFRDEIQIAPDELVGKKMTPAESALAAQKAYDILSVLPEISHETAEDLLRSLAEELGLSAGQVFGILRIAVTGQTVSPPLFESMQVIGKELVLERIRKAISILQSM
jgi:glutamyl-tRNA synthetase